MNTLTRGLAPLFCAAALAGPAAALEVGSLQYPLGADTSNLATKLPVTGLYGGLSFFSYRADESVDYAGNTVPTFSFDADSVQATFLYVWPEEIMGTQAQSFVVLAWADRRANLDLSIPTPGGPVPFNRNYNSDNWEFQDMTIGQLFTWQQTPTWTFSAGAALHLPTGNYENNGFISGGADTYTFLPQFRASYRGPNGLFVDTKTQIGIQTRNKTTDYQNGRYVTFEGAIGYQLNDRFSIGLNGYALYQFTDDEGPGVDPSTGNRTQIYGIGPQINFALGRGGLVRGTFKYQKEFDVVGGPQGEKFWLQVGIPLAPHKASLARFQNAAESQF